RATDTTSPARQPDPCTGIWVLQVKTSGRTVLPVRMPPVTAIAGCAFASTASGPQIFKNAARTIRDVSFIPSQTLRTSLKGSLAHADACSGSLHPTGKRIDTTIRAVIPKMADTVGVS